MDRAKILEPIDAVIMGAGAAGSYMAARLATAGKKVRVLEMGPAWEMSDLVSSQIWARRLKWGGAPVLPGGDNPFGHNMSTGWGFGGAALHHYAGWPRLHEEDFRVKSLYGHGLDWPISYKDLRPFYDRIQAEVGISGDAAAEVWRPPASAYPMPPLKWFRQGDILKQGFEKLGKRVSPAPMAINSVWYKDRPPCLYDGWCDAGCPIYALANPLATYLPLATRSGAEFQAGCQVTAIEVDGKGRAEGLRYFDGRGKEYIQPADFVILAGAAVQNARLLLASRSLRHPNGFGNGSGLVGRYFSCHVLSNVYGLFNEETECHMGFSAGALMSQDGYGKQKEAGFGSHTWGIAAAVKPNDLLGLANTRADLFGEELKTFVQRARRHFGSMNGICETVPQPENRIELADQRDKYGMPLARIRHTLAPEGAALWQHVNQEGLDVMKAAGATESWHDRRFAFAHVAGGAIMGEDPARSVTDSYGRLHDAQNVLVAGGGLFPTIGAVSPTFSILSLAARTMDHIMGG
jgi:choline dehydrogenase-like flavoprotein